MVGDTTAGTASDPRKPCSRKELYRVPKPFSKIITLQHWLDGHNSQDTVPWLFSLLAPCCAPGTRVDIPVCLVPSLNKTSMVFKAHSNNEYLLA